MRHRDRVVLDFAGGREPGGSRCTIAAWIDLDGDGTFEASELATAPCGRGPSTSCASWNAVALVVDCAPSMSDAVPVTGLYPGTR